MSIFINKIGIRGVENHEKPTHVERLLLKMVDKIATMVYHIVNMFFHVSKLKKEELSDLVSF